MARVSKDSSTVPRKPSGKRGDGHKTLQRERQPGNSKARHRAARHREWALRKGAEYHDGLQRWKKDKSLLRVNERAAKCNERDLERAVNPKSVHNYPDRPKNNKIQMCKDEKKSLDEIHADLELKIKKEAADRPVTIRDMNQDLAAWRDDLLSERGAQDLRRWILDILQPLIDKAKQNPPKREKVDPEYRKWQLVLRGILNKQFPLASKKTPVQVDVTSKSRSVPDVGIHLGVWCPQRTEACVTSETRANEEAAELFLRRFRALVLPRLLEKVYARNKNEALRLLELWAYARLVHREAYGKYEWIDLGPVASCVALSCGATELPHIDWSDPKAVKGFVLAAAGEWEGADLLISDLLAQIPIRGGQCVSAPFRNYRHCSTPFWAKTPEERLIVVLFWNAGLMPPVEEIGLKTPMDCLGHPICLKNFPKLRKIIYKDDFIRIVDRTAALEDAMNKHLKRKTGFWASYASRGARAEGSDLVEKRFNPRQHPKHPKDPQRGVVFDQKSLTMQYYTE